MTVIIVGIFGLILGSFINALVWRIKNKKDWVKERSVCVYCNHELQARYLVPVLSWLWLKGKCAYCKKPISWHYPAIELFTALVFMVSYLAWQEDFSIINLVLFVLWLKIAVLLVALLLYDLKWMLLPNKLVLPLTVLSFIFVVIRTVNAGDWNILVSSVAGALVLSGVFWGLFEVSKGKWIGGGDVKIAVSLGLLAGSPLDAFLVLFAASVLGTLVALPLMLSKKAKANTKLPFGPFLIIATFLVFFWGGQLTDWYSSLLYF